MRFRIKHVTQFAYEGDAYESHNEIRLKPREGPDQRLVGFRLEVLPHAAVVEYQDAFGNIVHALSVHDRHRELKVIAESLVERSATQIPEIIQPFSEFLAGDGLRSLEEYDFLHASRFIPFSDQLKRLFWMARPKAEEPVADYAQRIVAWVRDQFAYEPGSTNVYSDVNEILSSGAGVCQDFAHLTIGILRLAGVPARYVSGYLAPPSDPGRQRPLGPQASHAWLEALLPEAGWIGLDPTHGCAATERHIRIGVGRDYSDVPPLRGMYKSAGSKQTMGVMLDVSEAENADDGGSDPGADQQ